jgi:site-specific DNA recombinase
VAVDARIKALEERAAEAEDRQRRLYKMVEDGIAELDDILKDRITALKAERDTARAALARATGASRPPISIGPDKITAFGNLMRERLTCGGVQFRKAYLGAIIDRIEVDDRQIRIYGRKDVLAQAVFANGGPIPGVRSFVRRWRTRQDSNL